MSQKSRGGGSRVKYRSENPVPEGSDVPLVTWLDDNQVEWEKDNVTGTIVAVYYPDYMDGINTPGWHLHFLSEDHSFGRHLLEVATTSATATYDITPQSQPRYLFMTLEVMIVLLLSRSHTQACSR